MADLPLSSCNTMLSALFVPTTIFFLSLHSADPTTAGINELNGGSYSRQPIQFSIPTNGTQSSTNSQLFTALPSSINGIWVGIFVNSSGAGFIAGSPIKIIPTLSSGMSIAFPVGAVTTQVS